MHCPFCNIKFEMILASAPNLPDIAPLTCGECGEVSVLAYDVLRKPSDGELEAIKHSPIWDSHIAPAIEIAKRHKKARAAIFN